MDVCPTSVSIHRAVRLGRILLPVIEKEFPYEVGIFKASDAFLEYGARELDKSINLYETLFLNGEFRPYYAVVGEL